jgi:hypothetical protein
MAAFKLDGRLLPLQQRVELKLSGGVHIVKGWPGAAAVSKHADIVGCERWLPAAGPADGGDGDLLPGLLVICLQTHQG